MNEDWYLDTYWDARYDDPWYAEDETDLDEDAGDEFWEDAEDDDFPLSLEYPGEDLQDLEPPF